MAELTREDIRRIVEEARALNLPIDAFWEMVEERLGIDHGDAFHFIAEDPVFFGFGEDEEVPTKPPSRS